MLLPGRYLPTPKHGRHRGSFSLIAKKI
jgi:hypothetical protein